MAICSCFLYLAVYSSPSLSFFFRSLFTSSSFLCFASHFEVQLCFPSVIFICRTCSRHIAAIIYSKGDGIFPISFYIFTAQLSLVFTDVQWEQSTFQRLMGSKIKCVRWFSLLMLYFPPYLLFYFSSFSPSHLPTLSSDAPSLYILLFSICFPSFCCIPLFSLLIEFTEFHK